MLGTAAAVGLGLGSSLISGVMGSKAADKAADASRAGSEAEIKYLTESRDLARSDVEPYRKAGYAALDAALSMVGLPGLKSMSSVYGNAPSSRGGGAAPGVSDMTPGGVGSVFDKGPGNAPFLPNQQGSAARGSSYIYRAAGGPVHRGQRAVVGEIRPEMLVTRSGMRPVGMRGPEVIRPNEPGYIIPNMRTIGGTLDGEHPLARNMFDYRHPIQAAFDNPRADRIGRTMMLHQLAQRHRSGNFVQRATGGPVVPGQEVLVGEGASYAPPPQNRGGMPGQYNFKTDPGYAFRYNEGLRAINASAAARGQAGSGGTMRALTRYGQGVASAEYQNVYNRIASIAGLGTQAASASGAYAMNAGQGMGSAAQNAGDARASGYLGQANAWGNALNQGFSWLGQTPGVFASSPNAGGWDMKSWGNDSLYGSTVL